MRFRGIFVPIITPFDSRGRVYESGIENITFMPTHMIKTGVSYVYSPGITAGVFNSYYSDRYDVDIVKPTRKLVNPTANAFSWLSVNLVFDMNKLFNIVSSKKYEFKLYGENLLDAKVYDPEFNRKNINTLPARAGISIRGEVKVFF